MDMFMPSEVARLVLGYLKEMDCVSTIRIYLTENPHLSEYVRCLHQGREYPTSIAGKSLTDILQDYCHMRTIAERNPIEVCKLITRIEGNLAQVKYLAANGHMRSGSLTSSITNHTTAQKASTRSMLMLSRKEKQSLLERRNIEALQISKPTVTVSVGSQTNPVFPVMVDRFVQTEFNVMLDASTQFTDAPLNISITSPQNSSLCSSTTCPTTPTCRPLESYSSSSSLVKSALMLNFGIETFQTPNKDRYLTEEGIWRSPRRKTQLPRKRLSYSPSPSAKKQKNSTVTNESDSNENVDVTALIDELLHNTALHERIAANINNVVSNTGTNVCNESASVTKPLLPPFEEPIPGEISGDICAFTSIQDDQMPEVIKTIVDRTECDPMFEAFLSIFLDKQDSNSRDSQFGLGSNDAPSPDTHGTPNPDIPPSTPINFPATPSTDQLVPTLGNQYFNLNHCINTPSSATENKGDLQYPDSSGLTTPTINSDNSTSHQEPVILGDRQTDEIRKSKSSPKRVEGTSVFARTVSASSATDSEKVQVMTSKDIPAQDSIESVQLFNTLERLQPYVRVLDFGTPVKTTNRTGDSKSIVSVDKTRHNKCQKEKKTDNRKKGKCQTKSMRQQERPNSLTVRNKRTSTDVNKSSNYDCLRKSINQQGCANKSSDSTPKCNMQKQTEAIRHDNANIKDVSLSSYTSDVSNHGRAQKSLGNTCSMANDTYATYKSDPSQIALAVMNVEEFLSGLKYVE